MVDAVEQLDYRLLDAVSLTARSDGTYAPICGHSGFWTRPEYREAVSALESALLPAGSEGDVNPTASPTKDVL